MSERFFSEKFLNLFILQIQPRQLLSGHWASRGEHKRPNMAANPPHYELDTNGIHGYCANFLWKNFQVIFPPLYHNPGFMYLPEKRHFIREVLPHQIKIIFEVSPYFLYFNRNPSIIYKLSKLAKLDKFIP